MKKPQIPKKKLKIGYQKGWKGWRYLKIAMLSGLGILAINLLINVTIKLPLNASKPVDAYFVLGGSISREIYVAKLAKQNPQIPILISQGSKDPCIWLIFQREKASLDKVLLEKCAQSTFGNLAYGEPILRQWNVHKVKLITSGTHVMRAKWLGKILLGAHGIWVDLEVAKERGVPGNQESFLKTGMDITRGLVWAFLSQAIDPHCSRVTKLADVDIQEWKTKDFDCERQGNLDYR